jgi:predicted Zn-dependent protease
VNNKYLVGLIGLLVGFLISFLWVRTYNKTHAPVAAPAATGGPRAPMSAAGGAGDEQATMGDVQQIIAKAKNNPKDFQAQLDAAAKYEEIKQPSGIVEYLTRAYEASPEEFMKHGELSSLLPQIAIYYTQEKKYDKADIWIPRAIAAAPTNNELRIEFASLYLQRDPPQPDKAISELQAIVKADPKNGHALGHLIEAYALKKDAARAEDALNRLREAEPANARLASLQTLVADVKAGKPVTLPKEE